MKQAHKYAALIPEMTKQEMDELTADIEANGLLEPIVLTKEDEILDGRHRYAACKQVGVAPVFETYEGDDPFGYVISKNLMRRQLTSAQRNVLAVELADYIRDNREGAQSEHPDGKSRDIAAKQLGVSKGMVSKTRQIKDEMPGVYEKMKKGGISMATAGRMYDQKNKPKVDGVEINKGFKMFFGELSGDVSDANGRNWTDKSADQIEVWIGTPEVGFEIILGLDEEENHICLTIWETKGGKKRRTRVEQIEELKYELEGRYDGTEEGTQERRF